MFLRRKSDEATQALRSNPARAGDGNGMGMGCGKNVPREAERTQPSGKKGVHKTEVQAVRWCSQDRDRRRRPIQKKGAGLKPGTTKEKSTARNGCATKPRPRKF